MVNLTSVMSWIKDSSENCCRVAKSFFPIDCAGSTEGGRQPDCLSPAGVFVAAFSCWSGAVLEQIVVGQALGPLVQFSRPILKPRRTRRKIIHQKQNFFTQRTDILAHHQQRGPKSSSHSFPEHPVGVTRQSQVTLETMLSTT